MTLVLVALMCVPEVEPLQYAPLIQPQRDSAVRGYPARRSGRPSPEWAETCLQGSVKLGDADSDPSECEALIGA